MMGAGARSGRSSGNAEEEMTRKVEDMRVHFECLDRTGEACGLSSYK